MMSVTVAGGSFDLPRKATTTKRIDTAKRDRWLRYGLGVSIAGLLIADTIALTNMSRENAERRADRAAARAAAADAAAADVAVAGDGFAAFAVPTDFSAYAPVVLAAAPAPAVEAAPVVALPSTGADSGAGATALLNESTTLPTPEAPPRPATETQTVAIFEEVVAVAEEVPVVGEPVAAVVAEVDDAEPVTEIVETELADATEDTALPLP